MAISASNFTKVKKFGLGTGQCIVHGLFTGPALYTSGGELITAALAKSAFKGLTSIDSVQFGGGFDPSAVKGALAVWDGAVVAGTSYGKIHFVNMGTDAHLHNLLVSGAVALGSGDHLGSQGGRLGQPGTGTTITSVQGQSGIQNSTVTVFSSEVAASTDLSTYVIPFTVYGR